MQHLSTENVCRTTEFVALHRDYHRNPAYEGHQVNDRKDMTDGD